MSSKGAERATIKGQAKTALGMPDKQRKPDKSGKLRQILEIHRQMPADSMFLCLD
jgi:hypothetical protein